jgi:glycosyltransferase involved in cell wall biosynthesis
MSDTINKFDLSFDDPTLPLVVATSTTNWHEPPRMRHQVTRQLCLFSNVLFVQLPFGSTHQSTYCEKINPRLNVVFMEDLSFARQKARTYSYTFGRLIHSLIRREVCVAVHQTGYRNAILINFSHEIPELMQSPIFTTARYLCNDEFIRGTGTSWKDRWCRRIAVKREQQVATCADQCLGVSSYLVEKLKQYNRNVHLFLPGHEFSLPRVQDVVIKDRKSRPVNVCFMGYINYRLRYDWLLKLAKRDDILLTLLGPVSEKNRVSVEQLEKTMHCQIASPLYGADLQHRLSQMDVLIIPYDRRIKAVQAVSSSNKFFQYLACGKPVVISDMPHFVQLPAGCVYRASSASEFVESVYQAFREDSTAYIHQRLEIAGENHWDSRGQFLQHLLLVDGYDHAACDNA